MAESVTVLLVANFADRVGGGEESLLLLARGLGRRFAPQAVVPGEGEVAARLRAAGVAASVVPLPPLRPWTAGAGLLALRRLHGLLASLRVALVHAHGSRGALYAGLAARSRGVPLVWHARIADRDPWLDGLLLRLSTRVIAISGAVQHRFAGSRHAGKIRVVYNGVDAEHWTPPDRPRTSGDPVVLLVGRLMPAKGQATLLAAVPGILERCPRARFVLLGDSPGGERERLAALARRLGVEAAVDIRPWTPDPRGAYREADVVVLPSRSEGFGRVLVEAACMARPVVASRVGGIPEVVVDGETGLLVPRDDAEALGRAVLRLLEDPALGARLGAAGRARALARFTARAHVGGVEAVYDEALAEAARA